MKQLFVTRPATDAELEELELALQREIPAFWITHVIRADNAVAVIIQADAGTPVWAFERLPGFAVGSLVLLRPETVMA